VDLAGGKGIGIGEHLTQDVAAAKEELALLFGKLVLVVTRLIVEALGDVAVGCLYRSSSLLDVAIHGRKERGFAAPPNLGALLGTGVNVRVGPVLLPIAKAGVVIGWFCHFEWGHWAVRWLKTGQD
jgi:hypothetical protein